jgi:hypothetical protein
VTRPKVPRADEEPREVVGLPAQAPHLPLPVHPLQLQHVVPRDPVLKAKGPPGVFPQVPPQGAGAPGGGVRGIEEAKGPGGLRDLGRGHPGLGPGGTGLGVHLEAGHTGEGHHDGLPQGHRPPGKAASRPPGHQRHPVAPGQAHQGLDLRPGLRQDHGQGGLPYQDGVVAVDLLLRAGEEGPGSKGRLQFLQKPHALRLPAWVAKGGAVGAHQVQGPHVRAIDPGGHPPNPEPAVWEGLNADALGREGQGRPDLPAWGHLQVSPHLGAKDRAGKGEYLLGTRPPGAYPSGTQKNSKASRRPSRSKR